VGVKLRSRVKFGLFSGLGNLMGSKVRISIFEAYLQSLASENGTSEFEISPFIKSISTGTEIPSK